MATKRMKPARPAASAPIGSQLTFGLRRAAGLKDQGRVEEAREHLEELHRRFPSRLEPLHLLLDIALESKNMVSYAEILDRMLKIAPDDPDFRLAQAGGNLSNGYLALGRERFARFLERWPEHEEAPKVRETLATVEEELAKTMDAAGIHQENRFELAARNDEIQAFIAQRRFQDARNLAQKLIDLDAFYAPAFNNVALTYLLEGQADAALGYAQRVLAFEPDNVHGLGNLARSLHLLGRREEAAEAAERMIASRAYATDRTGKIAEILSFIGDDVNVLAVYKSAQQDKDDPSLENPLLHHLAGAAAMRLGQQKEAQQYWKEALKLDPDFELAKENLVDLKLPVEERHGPWAFPFDHWIPVDTLRDIGVVLEASIKSNPEQAMEKALQTFLQKHPSMQSLAPMLLERGDPAGRQFAILLAKTAKTPELLSALRDFAQSQNGTDRMRMDAANAAIEAGALDGGMVRLWARGEWREVMLMNWELHGEPEGSHSPRVEKLASDATEALYEGDEERSELLLKQALEIEPDAPDLLNNLANAYKMQKRNEEAKELMLQIYERFPGYFFGIVNRAHLWREAGKLKEAEEVLKPLLSQKRLHYSEFAALAQAQIELLLAKKDPESARQWYEMWKQAIPDDPRLARYGLQFESPNLAKPGLLRNLFKRR